MKKDKEYPATHSMSTAWYMVDDEGNVGIMEYEDNGPVPYGLEECLFANDLLFGYDDGVKDFVNINLTDEQIKAFLKNPCSPFEFNWYGNCIVKIDTTKTERFLKLSAYKGKKNISCHCISKKMGVYLIDAWDCVKDYSKQVIEGVLKIMLDENIILEVYEFEDIDSFYDLVEFKYDYPYYLYSQPYNPELLQRRVFVPKNPVKITQIPKHFREKIHRIKGCFKDLETMQIAQRYQCKFYGWESSYIIDGVIYELITLEDGNKGYVKTDILAYPFKDYCPDAKQSSCNEYCLDRLYEVNNKRIYNNNPTVLILCSYYSDFYEKINVLNSKACIIEYSEFVPCLYIPKNKDLKVKDYLDEISRRAKPYLEKMIEYMNPYVIVSDNDYFEVLKQTYGISNGEIEINNNIYPIYNIDDINEYKEEIIQLANQEYRGIYYPMVISQEEMQELEKENIAIKIKD
ncbi:MAG: hypothetical protein J6U84_05660 [Bacteroidales bacterium]|nr:hypothetical protein [Bacteroidales bacterium]